MTLVRQVKIAVFRPDRSMNISYTSSQSVQQCCLLVKCTTKFSESCEILNNLKKKKIQIQT